MDDWKNTRYEDRDYGVGGQPGGYSSEGEDWKVLGGIIGIGLIFVVSIGLFVSALFF